MIDAMQAQTYACRTAASADSGRRRRGAGRGAGVEPQPAMTRDQVRQRLWPTAQYYPTRSSEEGHGVTNAYRAVSGN